MSFVPVVLLFILLVVREFTFHQERAEWVSERRELLNRVQKPEWIPMSHEWSETSEPEVDEFNLIGSIVEAVDE